MKEVSIIKITYFVEMEIVHTRKKYIYIYIFDETLHWSLLAFSLSTKQFSLLFFHRESVIR